MRLPRTLTCLITAAALAALAGCGSEDADTPASSSSSSSAPSSGPSSAGGDEADNASGGLIDICNLVTDAEISDLLDGKVTKEEVPGGGCNFSNEDNPRAASLQINASVIDDGAGGFEGSIAGLEGVLQGAGGGAVEGVGDQAYVKTGTFAGSEFVRGSGLVRVGTTAVQVDLSPNEGTSAKDVRAIVVDALTLVASKG